MGILGGEDVGGIPWPAVVAYPLQDVAGTPRAHIMVYPGDREGIPLVDLYFIVFFTNRASFANNAKTNININSGQIAHRLAIVPSTISLISA